MAVKDWTLTNPVDHTLNSTWPEEIRNNKSLIVEGGVRWFYQATSGPTTRYDGTAFDSDDVGRSVWVDSDDNNLYILTATTPTWTSLESVIEAMTLSLAEVLTQAEAPVFTKGIVANNSYLVGRNQADDGNVDLIKVGTNDLPTLPDGAEMASNAEPVEDEAISNKKYVDDQIVAKTQTGKATGTSNITNTSGDWADMADMEITITTTGGNVLLLFTASISGITNTDNVGVRFDVDGTPRQETYVDCVYSAGRTATTIHWLETSLGAVSHTFKVQWKDITGTAEQDGATYPRVFTAVEFP